MVKDAKYSTMREEIPRQIFVPYLQAEYGGEMSTLVRTTLPASQMFTGLRSEVRKLDSNLPVYRMRTMENQIEQLITRSSSGWSQAFRAYLACWRHCWR